VVVYFTAQIVLIRTKNVRVHMTMGWVGVALALIVIVVAGAIYYRKRPAEHKGLMLMPAINFVAAAIARIPLLPQMAMFQYFWLSDVLALASLGYFTWKHKKFDWTFGWAVALLILSQPLTIVPGYSKPWLDLAAWFANTNVGQVKEKTGGLSLRFSFASLQETLN
jgi:hypothetical protein